MSGCAATGVLNEWVCKVWCSTLKRSIQMAAPIDRTYMSWHALDDIDYGSCNRLTVEQVLSAATLSQITQIQHNTVTVITKTETNCLDGCSRLLVLHSPASLVIFVRALCRMVQALYCNLLSDIHLLLLSNRCFFLAFDAVGMTERAENCRWASNFLSRGMRGAWWTHCTGGSHEASLLWT